MDISSFLRLSLTVPFPINSGLLIKYGYMYIHYIFFIFFGSF